MPRRSKKSSNNNNNNKKSRRKKPKFLSLRHLNLNLAADDETSAVAADLFAATADNSLSSLFGPISSPSDSLTGADVAAHDSTTCSPSLTCTAGNEEREREREEENLVLVRTAMRRGREKEEEEREEKWVCYEEVTSCCCCVDDDDDDDDANVHRRQKSGMLLSLKLDYQEIIDAWCDKGPFYMPGPQIVPHLSLDFGLNDGWRSNGTMWTVPENTVGVKMEHELEEELKIRHREASVLRYKEKRQNRLFSKRIRYEVRKINAEKRPRMKGRFVKRS